MSLLLEALKKAELAKQIAKAESPTAEPAANEPAPTGPASGVITREKLPDITQPLEILTDDLPSAEQKAAETASARPELALQEPDAYSPQAPQSPIGADQPGARAQADQLFQVKEMEYNPRRPFYMTLAALGVVALGYIGYVWWQMQPKYAYSPVAATPAPAAPVAVVTPSAPAPQAVAPAPPLPAPAAAPASTAVATIPPIQPVRPRQRPGPIAASPGPASPRAQASTPSAAQDAPIAINAPILTVDPLVEQGYQAFQRNDLPTARESYQRALAREPRSRDALLGLAAIDVRSGELEAAESRYLRLLEMDPRDSQATAGLIALRGRLDPVAAESRLKSLIASQPDVAHLYFSLGNQYAQQSRWTEAQAAYFKAYSLDPENADFAYNLAVSLDQLRQKKNALEYYQRAVTLADKRAATFNAAQARVRVQELSK
jgi:tetratricopeptide (TPR) repeat protein